MPLSSKKPLLLFLMISLILILITIDQASKGWLITNLKQEPSLMIKVGELLDIVYTWNYGISFGMFKNYYQYSNRAFIILNSIIVGYIFYLLFKSKTILIALGYIMIISGAVGNLIDRFLYGAVFDFIYFHYQDYGFAVFNLADAFITLGVILIIYDYYLINRKKFVEGATNVNYDGQSNSDNHYLKRN